MSAQLIDYLAVLSLGAMIGFVEILARYKDAPFKVSFSPPGALYILINAGVSALALWSVRLFDLKFSDNPNMSPEMVRWLQIGISGLSAMTLFRSSLFMFRVGDQDVSVGPNAILQILLVAVDKEVDRTRGAQRAKIVETAMEGIRFNDAVSNLPPVVVALMQNLSDKDQGEIVALVEEAKRSLKKGVPERAVTMTLGLGMINVVGEDILIAAIDMVNLDEQRQQPKSVMSKVQEIFTDTDAKRKAQELKSIEEADKSHSTSASPLVTNVSTGKENDDLVVDKEKLRRKLSKK